MKHSIQSIIDSVKIRRITLGMGKLQLARLNAPYEQVALLLADSHDINRVTAWCEAVSRALALWDDMDANKRAVRRIASETAICSVIALLVGAGFDLRDAVRCEAFLQTTTAPRYTTGLYVDFLRNANGSDWRHWLACGQWSRDAQKHLNALAVLSDMGAPNPYKY